MNRTLKIFISCALGSGLGAMVALEVHQYFWWVGLIVGGLAGYLSYEFEKVPIAVREAWHDIAGWKPDREFWKEFSKYLGTSLLLHISLGVTTFVGITILMFFVSLFTSVVIISVMEDVLIVNFIIMITFTCFGLFLPVAELNKTIKKMRKERISAMSGVKKYNLVAFYFVFLPQQVAVILPKAVLLAKTVLVLIYSEARLICGVGAVIGTVIGYFTGHILIGMLAGGIIGIINYEIISKRILHLVPSKG